MIKRMITAMKLWIPIFLKYISGFISLHLFHRELLKKNIWIIGEKKGEARDNGYHFFKYIRSNHPEINAYFVISSNAMDYSKVAPYGNIIEQDSKNHMLYYLAAKYSINSQPCGSFPYIINKTVFKATKILRNPNQKCVFLQHGIIVNAMPGNIISHKAGFHDLFISSSTNERDFIVSEYAYPDNYVALTGLCRYDMLAENSSKKERVILLMPTWRRWFSSDEIDFSSSEYFNVYLSVLKSERLKKMLKEYNHKLIFYPHYVMQKYIDSFVKCANEVITIASKNDYDVQDLLIRSDVLITDYSSIFFDFAYMNKPLIYYQFDEEKFYSGHYQRGYFSYRENGFGKVVKDEELLLDELEKILKRGCVTELLYAKRRDEFFEFKDNCNCKRVFEAISSL